MASFSIESNGRIEKTAIYFNGEQLGGIRELLLNLDEDGTFDAVMQYEGTDHVMYTKRIFEDYLEKVRTTEPSFTEEEARELRLLTIESDGDIGNTLVTLDGQQLEGITSLLVQIKTGPRENKPGGLRGLFSGRDAQEQGEDLFRAEATFRNEDESMSTENIF